MEHTTRRRDVIVTGGRRFILGAAAAAGAFVALAAPPHAQVSPQGVRPLGDDPVGAAARVWIWYRGEPAGVPRLDDLAELRALGFSAVIWPASAERGATAARRMAAQVGLTLDVRASEPALTPDRASTPGRRVTIGVGPGLANFAAAIAWRAIAHGARDVGFDAGESSSGLVWRDRSGALLPWVAEARALTRQFEFNAALVGAFGRSMAMTIEGAIPGIEVALVDAGRSWVIVATNVSAARVRGAARLPRAVPAAPWSNLFDGEVMAMLDQPEGPRWSFELMPGQAKVFAVDK
jgi:hypothetical protein